MELSRLWVTHKRLVVALICCLAVAVLSAASYFVIQANQPKQVTLTVDGVTNSYETHAKTVQEFLTEQGISFTEKDSLQPSATTPLKDELAIQLDTSWSVSVLVDGQTKVIHTLKRNVADVLQEAGIATGELDQVEPAPTSSISKGTKIQITRIEEKMVTVDERVPFQEMRKNDSSLVKGESRILQKGEEGKATAHYKVRLKDGKEISRELVKRDIVTPKKDRIIAVGTAKKAAPASVDMGKEVVAAAGLVSRGGKNFRPHSVLKSATLTAYSPEVGTRTATGTKAEAGRTIAVDPDVIPLGWWVYIEGVGYRRAEDTGGAVNGHKIDVFLNSEAEARRFGRKKGRTVYVIGPKLP